MCVHITVKVSKHMNTFLTDTAKQTMQLVVSIVPANVLGRLLSGTVNKKDRVMARYIAPCEE